MQHQPITDARYDSISEFMDAMRLPPLYAGNTEAWKGVGFGGGAGHYNAAWFGAGCKDGNAVQAMVRDGWSEGRDRMLELSDKLNDIPLLPKDRRRRVRRTDQGDDLDMAQVYAGRLDVAWTTARRIHTAGPQRIDIVANMICSGHEHPDVLFWRGAAAAVLTDLLETAGYMVRLVVNFGGMQGDVKTSCRITVKDHGMPLDITSTSAVILPGFFRALGHAWLVNHAKRQTYVGISVGEGIVDAGELMLSHKVRDHGSALAFVNDTIARINDNSLAA